MLLKLLAVIGVVVVKELADEIIDKLNDFIAREDDRRKQK